MGYRTEKEHIQSQERGLFLLDRVLSDNSGEFMEVLNHLPGIFHTNKKKDVSIVHLNQLGEKWINIQSEIFRAEGAAIFEKIIHPDTRKWITPKFIEFANFGKEHQVYCNFQKVLNPRTKDYNLFITLTKPYKNTNLLITISNPVSDLEGISNKLRKVVGEEDFVRKYFQKFKQLTPREVEVLTLISSGHTNKEISHFLFLSIETVKQHRKNIKRKLEVRNVVGMVRYARAFDLI